MVVYFNAGTYSWVCPLPPNTLLMPFLDHAAIWSICSISPAALSGTENCAKDMLHADPLTLHLLNTPSQQLSPSHCFCSVLLQPTFPAFSLLQQ